ncbi:signal transducing adapter molecule 1 [Scaptodrosophila lebanonensis]|uniref:Signal transducing adapter molecule 1 n=1 Tax=Drosophila lebanonensis TaxID=7225 RepID=A0A6J2U668_DROLE|nr:signal transducing adapter molecule 1 [Scaptodrosophila lebanonensis]
MGIFGQSSPFDTDVEKATSETNTNENWSLILDVCDKVTTNPRTAKDCLKAVMKRMGHADPHVVMQAITLLDACANNCGKPFHLEVASREFETEFRRLLGKAQPKVSLKMRQVLKNWAENDFKNDPELNLIPTLYTKLRIDGYDFSNLNDKSTKSAAAKAASLPKDPNVVSSQQEEDDIAKAIELSLKETKQSPKLQSSSSGSNGGTASSATSSVSTAYPSLYPSFGGGGSSGGGGAAAQSSVSSNGGSAAGATTAPEPRKVRALYDFEAAEENELTFFSGEIIHVLDDSDPNWWKGFNQRGEGLFPSNFVTADLSVDPERLDINQQHKSAAAQKEDEAARELQLKTEAAAAAAANQPVEIDETKIDRLLHLLHEANPEDPSTDSEEMLRLEQEVHQMGPLIDAELERVDRKHAQLTQLSSDLVDAINLYHSLMRDDRAMAAPFPATSANVATGGFMPGGFPGAALYGAPGYPNAGGFAPQNFGMQSLPYAPVTSATASTTAPSTGYAPQIPMPYQNGHAPQLNSLPPHLTQPPAAAPQSIYSSPTSAVSTQQSTQPQPNYHGMLPTEQQPHALPPQFTNAAGPPQATQMPLPPQHYMSPQHQPPPQQAYMPGQAQPPQQQQPTQTQPQHQPQLYATNGLPAAPQNYMPPQQQSQQQQQAPAPPPTHHIHNDQFSQLQQQMAAMTMSQHVGMPPQGAPTNFHIQNDAVKSNNIPIYQQQR